MHLQSLVFFLQRRRDRLVRPPAGLCLARIAAKSYPTAGQAIPPPLDTSCYSAHTTAPRCNRTSYNPSPPLNLRHHCRVFPSPIRSRRGPCRCPAPRCVRCGVVNKRVIRRGLYVESLTAGTHEVHGRTQGKFLLIKLKKMFPPPNSWYPPAVSSHGRKCLLVMRKKLFLPMTAGTRQICG